MSRFLVAFVVLLALSFSLELTPWAQAWLVTPWTDAVARVAGTLMRMFDASISTTGNVIATTRSAFAFAFQFGSLILPAVALAVLWVALNQRFVAALRRRSGPPSSS